MKRTSTRATALLLALMALASPTPFGDSSPLAWAGSEAVGLEQLRAQANSAMSKGAEEFLDFLPSLRADRELWPLWCAIGAQAARSLQRPDARALLDQAISAGFSQPRMVESAFSKDADWSQLVERMEANVPPPALRVLDWPEPPVSLPLHLDKLSRDRESVFRRKLPSARASAWETARAILSWTQSRWQHVGNHSAKTHDALAILERAENGERFRCVEYADVLAAALNAHGIPARTIGLRDKTYYFGLGLGHVVAEAWIDDLGKWVLLDGQNGAYWQDAGGPLSAHDLARRYDSGNSDAAFMQADGTRRTDARQWWSYFAWFDLHEAEWAPEGKGFVPYFQGEALTTKRLVKDPGKLYPDLGTFWVGLGEVEAKPALRLEALHPYAKGFVIDGRPLQGNPVLWPFPDTPGKHEVAVAVQTPYGTLAKRRVVVEVAAPTPHR